MNSANERQVGGDHYVNAMQHWDIVAAHKLDYFQGQITKYVMRWKRKNGIEDLIKAKHFLEKYIELEEPQTLAKATRTLREQGLRIYPGRAPTTRERAQRIIENSTGDALIEVITHLLDQEEARYVNEASSDYVDQD